MCQTTQQIQSSRVAIQSDGQGDMDNNTENSNTNNEMDDQLNPLFLNPPFRGIFIQPTCAPMVFGIRSGKDMESLRRHIWRGGGKVEDPEKDEDTTGHRITLYDPNTIKRPRNVDIFKYQYILDCVRDNVLKENLVEYRINMQLNYEYYDPLEVLLGYKKWEDLRKRISLLDLTANEEECSDIDEGTPKKKSKAASDDVAHQTPTDAPEAPKTTEAAPSQSEADDAIQSAEGNVKEANKEAAGGETNDESPSILQSESETTYHSPHKQLLRLKRLPYSKREQQEIVDYIINTKSYKLVKGRELWQSMEKDKTVCKGQRTWQSMKEHFRQQIVPRLHTYINNDKVATKFKRALLGLPVDVGDTDSDEEQEKQVPKKKNVAGRDEYDRETDLSGSDSEGNAPYQSVRKRRITEDNQPRASNNDKVTHHRERSVTQKLSGIKEYGGKNTGDRDGGTSTAGGDTTEEDESDIIREGGKRKFMKKRGQTGESQPDNALSAEQNSILRENSSRVPETIPSRTNDSRMKIIRYSSNPLNIPAPANPLHRQIHDEIYKSMLKLHGLEQSEVFDADDNESIRSTDTGSIRSASTRSPRKKVKLWHPSQDNVSPFQNEVTERNMRRKLNSYSATDNSTQTPEKNKEPHVETEDQEVNQDKNSRNDLTASPLKLNEADSKSSPRPKRGRNLEFEDATGSPQQQAVMVGEVIDGFEPQPSTSAGLGISKTARIQTRAQRIQSIESSSSTDLDNSGNTDGPVCTSLNERQKDDHIFLKPKNYRKAFESEMNIDEQFEELRKKHLNQPRRKEQGKVYRSLDSPERNIQQPINQRTNSEELNKGKGKNWAPMRRAEQAADEDMAWTPSNFRRLPKHSSSSSDEDSIMSRRSKTKRKKNTKQKRNAGESSMSSDGSSNKQQPRFYSRNEEVLILNFIVQQRAFSQCKGNKLWEIMEAAQVLPDRTPQSMKERFRKHIFPRLDTFENLSAEDIENFKNPPSDDNNRNAEEEETDNQSRNMSSQTQLGETSKERETRRDDDEISTVSFASRRSTTSSVMSGFKPSRNYTLHEDNAILKFIVTNRRFTEVKGNTLWALMEAKKIVPNRSSQSLKERFRRNIAPNLSKYSILSAKDIDQFEKNLSAESAKVKQKPK